MKKFFRKIKARVIYYNAVRLAQRCHEHNGGRYFVVATTGGKLLVMDKKNFRGLKRKHYLPDIGTYEFTARCVYYTPNRSGVPMGDELREKRKTQFLCDY